jgi:hypothetical protein
MNLLRQTSFLLVASVTAVVLHSTASSTLAFQAPSLATAANVPFSTSKVGGIATTALSSSRGGGGNSANNDQEFMRWAKQSRSAGASDTVVELLRPLGLVLNEDKRTGNVYVETVAPNGNAARTGKVREQCCQGWTRSRCAHCRAVRVHLVPPCESWSRVCLNEMPTDGSRSVSDRRWTGSGISRLPT